MLSIMTMWHNSRWVGAAKLKNQKTMTVDKLTKLAHKHKWKKPRVVNVPFAFSKGQQALKKTVVSGQE